jgi:hypothetical protein
VTPAGIGDSARTAATADNPADRAASSTGDHLGRTAAASAVRAAVVLVTADDTIRAPIRQCAARAGAFVAQYGDLVSAQQHHAEIRVLLVGADLATAAAEVRLPRAQQVIVVATGEPDFAVFTAAAALRATYVTGSRTDRRWLIDQLAAAATETVDRLQAAGFRLGYTDRGVAETYARVQALQVSRWRQDPTHAVYVSLEDVARDECAVGQSSTVDRSNYRTLHRRYPGLWTDLVYSNAAALGAFVADLPPDVVDLLCGLRQDYAVLDEDDLAELEQRDIRTSWQQAASAEVRRGIGEDARDVWDALEPEHVDRLWWETVTGIGAWPQHDGHQVRWDVDRLVPAFAGRLLAEFRRTWRPDPGYRIDRIDSTGRRRCWEPGWQVSRHGQVIATAYSRHAARVAAWQHQRTN